MSVLFGLRLKFSDFGFRIWDFWFGLNGFQSGTLVSKREHDCRGGIEKVPFVGARVEVIFGAGIVRICWGVHL